MKAKIISGIEIMALAYQRRGKIMKMTAKNEASGWQASAA
jgi:hypothetical protein